MSPQAGIWNLRGKPIEPTVFARLGAAIDDDGPDGAANYVDFSIGIAYRALHTTAESRREIQPHKSPSGYVLTWDGRLDNREELAGELFGRSGLGDTDLQIVAAALDRWGTGSFRRLMGDWAISIWKPVERELVLAVDYLAIRHIFYRATPESVWWSSNITPLVLLSGAKFHVDEGYVAGYLSTNPDAHSTPYREIRQVPPGQFVELRDTRLRVQRYWHPDPLVRIRYKSDAEYEAHFRDLFRRSIRRRLRSDTAVLAELSGGLDSSSIVCMADDILGKEGAQTTRLDTLSSYDKTEPDGDDWIYVQLLERMRGQVGAHIDISPRGTSFSSFSSGEFSAFPSHFNVTRRIRARRENILQQGNYRVVLSGIGGDEFLGGIPDPSAHLADAILQGRLLRLARELKAWSLVKRRPWVQLLFQALAELSPPCVRRYCVARSAVESWIPPRFARRAHISRRQLGDEDSFGFLLPTRRSFVHALVHMSNKLAKLTRSPLEEPRFPYLDQTLIEFLLAVPAEQLLRPGQRRSLMRRALGGLVPSEILARRTKQFAARTPMIALRSNWEEIQELFRSSLSSSLGYVDDDLFLQRLDQAKSGKEIHLVRMMRTISLECWLRSAAAEGLLDDVPPGGARGQSVLIKALRHSG